MKKLPKHVREDLNDVIWGLHYFTQDAEVARLLIDPDEDDNKKVKAALKGKHAAELNWTIGYVYAIADVFDCETSELFDIAGPWPDDIAPIKSKKAKPKAKRTRAKAKPKARTTRRKAA